MTQPDLGARLRSLRQQQNLSLAEVSAATDISLSFLSMVETGKSDITFGRLSRLVDFYGVAVSDLLPESPSHDPVVVRSDEQRHLESPVEGMDVYLLGPNTARLMMPVVAVFAPGGQLAEYARHPGEEFIYVLEGKIKLELDGREPVVLEKGDGAYYRSDRAHSFTNVGKGGARLFGCVSPPNW